MKLGKGDLKKKSFKIPDLKRNKSSFIGAACVLFIFAAGILPSSIQFVTLKSQSDNVKKQILQSQEKIRNLPRLVQKKEEYTKNIRKLEKQFFDAVFLPNLIGLISEVASQADVRILSSKPMEFEGDEMLEENKFYKPFIINLELESGFHELGKFINILETNEKWFRISELSVTKKNDVKEHKLIINMSILTFLKKI